MTARTCCARAARAAAACGPGRTELTAPRAARPSMTQPCSTTTANQEHAPTDEASASSRPRTGSGSALSNPAADDLTDCRQGLLPRESAGASDFDATRRDIELLSASPDGPTLAGHAIDRIADLIPGLTSTAITQIKGWLEIAGVRLKGAGTNARPFLGKLAVLYDDGPRSYFTTVTGRPRRLPKRGSPHPPATRGPPASRHRQDGSGRRAAARSP